MYKLYFEETTEYEGAVKLFEKYYDGDKGKLVYEKGSGGKPLVAGRDDIHFNVSHSGDLVLLGISDRPIGVDIQVIKPLRADIAGRFFHSEEKEYLSGFSEAEYEEMFYRIWALKESYVKCDGKGIGMGLNTFSVLKRIDGDSFIKAYDGQSYAVAVTVKS